MQLMLMLTFVTVSEIPQSYTEAVHSPDFQNSRNAMDEEMHSLKENDTFTLTPFTRR